MAIFRTDKDLATEESLGVVTQKINELSEVLSGNIAEVLSSIVSEKVSLLNLKEEMFVEINSLKGQLSDLKGLINNLTNSANLEKFADRINDNIGLINSSSREQLEKLQVPFEKLQSDLEGVQRELGRVYAPFENVRKDIGKIHVDLDNFHTDLACIVSRFDETDGKVSKFRQGVEYTRGTLAKYFEVTRGQLDSIEKILVNDIRKKLDAHEEQAHSVRSDVLGLYDKLNEKDNASDEYIMNTLSGFADRMNSELSKNTRQFESVSKKILYRVDERDASSQDMFSSLRNESQSAFSRVFENNGDIMSSISSIKGELKHKATVERPTAESVPVNPYGSLERELEVCARLQKKSLFVIGYARSSTTVTAEVINTCKDVIMLSEANFFAGNQVTRFRDWYNAMRESDIRIASKIDYAHDFIPERDHVWWEWLDAASNHYSCVGEKIALSAYHFDLVPPEKVQSFFESRFLTSKYVFLLRNPIQTLLSVKKLFNYEDEKLLKKEVLGWLTYVKMWCNFVRLFPNTLSLCTDKIDRAFFERLQSFSGLDLSDANKIVDPKRRQTHKPLIKNEAVHQMVHDLANVYDCALKAIDVLGQASEADSDAIPASVPAKEVVATWSAAQEMALQLRENGVSFSG